MAIGAVQPLQLHGVAAFGMYAAGVLVVGAALHYAVERPFLRWRERLDEQRRRAWPATADAAP